MRKSIIKNKVTIRASQGQVFVWVNYIDIVEYYIGIRAYYIYIGAS